MSNKKNTYFIFPNISLVFFAFALFRWLFFLLHFPFIMRWEYNSCIFVVIECYCKIFGACLYFKLKNYEKSSFVFLVPYNLIKFNTNYMHFLHRYHHHLTWMYFFHEFHPGKSRDIQWLYRNWYEEMRRLMNLDIKEWITVARNDQNIRISILPNHVIFIFSFHSINSWFFRNVFGLCYRNARNRKIKGFKEFPREFNNSAIARASGTKYNL